MTKLTLNSRIKDVLNNPVARDVVLLIINSMPGVLNMAMIDNPVVRNIRLRTLPKLSKGMASEALLLSLIDILNRYAEETLPTDSKTTAKAWWKEGVCYQIYPRSFYDSDGDGIGDLKGITAKLDYLSDLGINMIWLSPVNTSPNADNGYDISDYYGIMEDFGTMADFDTLLNEAHARDIKIIMDIVVNHTSDEHAWFKDALKSKDSPTRDYYIWKKSKDNNPPNNWTSIFSGPAWKRDDKSGEWYMHLFTEKQVDLNWENAKMRGDIYKMMNWWADKGVDGFRLDVISFIAKAEGLPDGDPLIGELMGFTGVEHYAYNANVHTYLKEMNREVFAKHDVVSIGETPGIGLEGGKLFVHDGRNELSMIFNFDHLETGGHKRFDDYIYDLDALKAYHIRWQNESGRSVWNSLFYENHDNPRVISKIIKDKRFRVPLGKLLAVMQMTLKGTPFIYQGQELGAINNQFDSIDEFNDVESINLYHELREKGEISEQAILNKLNAGSRDHTRSPMQWDDSETAGFTSGTPWLKVNPDKQYCNVKTETENLDSVLAFYKDIIRLRKQTPALIYGDFLVYKPKAHHYFAYYRILNDISYFIEMNLSAKDMLSKKPDDAGELIISNYNTEDELLKPYEARVYRCDD